MTPQNDREREIIGSLKHCSEDTVQAALRFQSSHSLEDLNVIIHGVLERDLPENVVSSLKTATDESRLIEDLGADSFGMMEVVMTAEEVFGISIANSDMKDISTLGHLKQFLLAKVGAKAAAVTAAETVPAS